MSKGTKMATFRIPPDLDAEIESAIEKRNEVTRGEPWTRTDFYLAAFREKLAHMERSRRSNRKSENAKPNKKEKTNELVDQVHS